MIEYVNPLWAKKLSQFHLKGFADFWDTENHWFEEVNQRREGWSGVITKQIGDQTLFIKKQHNHNFKTWLHPFKGEPTFKREFDCIQRLQKLNIPTLEVIFFGIRENNCILVTKSLNKDHRCLSEVLDQTQQLSDDQIKVIAKSLKQLHLKNIQHTYPIPKHIYLNQDNSSMVLIDLEKMKFKLVRFQCVARDLYSFLKFTHHFLTRTQRELFFQTYFEDKNSWLKKIIMNKIKRKLGRYHL